MARSLLYVVMSAQSSYNGTTVMETTESRERRRLERFTLRAFTIVRTMSPGKERAFELFTQDISSGGAFFPDEVPLPKGEKLRLTLYLPSTAPEGLKDTPARVKVVTKGEVVRSGQTGIAVKFFGRYAMSRASA